MALERRPLKPGECVVERDNDRPAEKLRVVEVIATDYVWQPQARGFYPVFGSTHGTMQIPGQHESQQAEHPRGLPRPAAMVCPPSPSAADPRARPPRLAATASPADTFHTFWSGYPW